jgi:hypothetical protein
MAEIYSKWSENIPTFSIPRPSKIYPNWDFGLKIYDLATLPANDIPANIASKA